MRGRMVAECSAERESSKRLRRQGQRQQECGSKGYRTGWRKRRLSNSKGGNLFADSSHRKCIEPAGWKSLSGSGLAFVIDRTCVPARGGGEHREVNDQSGG